MKESDCGGLEPSAMTDESPGAGDSAEPITDGGFSRRVFLGAAATLSTLTVGATGSVAADGGTEEDGGGDGEEETEYGRNTVVNTSGGLEVWTDGEYGTKVKVSSHPEGIGLQLVNEIGQMNVLLLPEDIDPLCKELLDARAKTRPEDVEGSREWITEDYRDGDE